MDKTTIQWASIAVLACSAAIHAQASELSPLIQRTADPGCPVETTVMRSAPQRAEAGTARLTVSVMLDNARGQEVQNVLAISADPQRPVMYEVPKSGNVYEADVEAGLYDVVVYIKSDNEDTQIFLFKEDENITSNKRILLNQRNATISTTISRTSPTGIELTLPVAGDPGNCTIADHLLMLRHKDFGTLLQDETAAFRKVCTRIQTNLIPQRFTMTRMDAYTWEEGPAFMVIPVDFGNEINGPSEINWHEVGASFAGTPMSDAWKAVQEPPLFNMTGYFVVADHHCNAYVGVGNYNHELPTDRMYYWVPEGYDGYYEYYPVLRENLIEMADASVSSMPYKMTADGLMPSGLNLSGSGSLMLTNGMIPAEGHPRFREALPEGAKLANAVPALVCIPSSTAETGWDNGFMYDFTGRHGEQLGIDAYNFTDILTDAELEQIGGYHRTIRVTRDGTEICTSPDKFVKWLNWGHGNSYGMEMEMNNVLIDGEIPGSNTASLIYKAADGFIPTLTSLQLRDNDIVTDRFDKGEHATLELTAATFSFVSQRNFTFKAPSGVKAEYAPHGDSEFSELTLTEVPENFYLPGYGTYYQAKLDKIDRKSDDKWYDLRITVEGEGGAVQTQTLSPAFRLEKPENLGCVTSLASEHGGCDIYSVDGRVVLRGVDGTSECDLEPGIYVVTGDGTTRKIIVQ